MNKIPELRESIASDVLVIGGGLSGFWAAIRAAEDSDLTVTIVDVGLAGRGGQSPFAQGETIALLPDEDNLDAWVEDIAQANEWLSPQDMVETMLAHSLERIKDHERFGIQYHRRDGKYWRELARGCRIVHLIHSPKGGGRSVMLALRAEALRRGVTVYNRTFVVDLVKDDQGRVAAAVTMNSRTGELNVITAKAIVLATNTVSFRSYFVYDQPGIGPVLAYRIGAELKNAEFYLIKPMQPRYYFEGQGSACAMGAKYVNGEGEPFMERYVPELGHNADYQYLIRAMVLEKAAGRDPIYFDRSFIKREDRFLWSENGMGGYMPVILRKLKEQEGIDVFDERQQIQPMHTLSKMGISTDVHGATAVPGLFAAGDAQAFNLEILNGHDYCHCIWSGHTAGGSAARFVRDAGAPGSVRVELDACRARLLAPLGRPKKVHPTLAVRRLKEVLFPGDIFLVQHQSRLEEALSRLGQIKQEFATPMAVENVHDLVRLIETECLYEAAEMVLRAALMRTETRSSHFRIDYPGRDDRDWLKWVVIRRESTGMTLRAEDIPFHRYKFKPPTLGQIVPNPLFGRGGGEEILRRALHATPGSEG